MLVCCCSLCCFCYQYLLPFVGLNSLFKAYDGPCPDFVFKCWYVVVLSVVLVINFLFPFVGFNSLFGAYDEPCPDFVFRCWYFVVLSVVLAINVYFLSLIWNFSLKRMMGHVQTLSSNAGILSFNQLFLFMFLLLISRCGFDLLLWIGWVPPFRLCLQMLIVVLSFVLRIFTFFHLLVWMTGRCGI